MLSRQIEESPHLPPQLEPLKNPESSSDEDQGENLIEDELLLKGLHEFAKNNPIMEETVTNHGFCSQDDLEEGLVKIEHVSNFLSTALQTGTNSKQTKAALAGISDKDDVEGAEESEGSHGLVVVQPADNGSSDNADTQTDVRLISNQEPGNEEVPCGNQNNDGLVVIQPDNGSSPEHKPKSRSTATLEEAGSCMEEAAAQFSPDARGESPSDLQKKSFVVQPNSRSCPEQRINTWSAAKGFGEHLAAVVDMDDSSSATGDKRPEIKVDVDDLGDHRSDGEMIELNLEDEDSVTEDDSAARDYILSLCNGRERRQDGKLVFSFFFQLYSIQLYKNYSCCRS